MRKGTVSLSAMAVLALALPAMAEAPKKPRRVWTNDDFAAAAPAATPAAPKLQISENGDDYTRIQKEVNDDLISAARVRDKTYDESVALMKKRLENEADPFRIEVLKKMIADTEQLRESNRRILKQFGAAEKAEPAADDQPAVRNQPSEQR